MQFQTTVDLNNLRMVVKGEWSPVGLQAASMVLEGDPDQENLLGALSSYLEGKILLQAWEDVQKSIVEMNEEPHALP